MAVREIDEAHLKTLHDQGKTHTEISRLLGIPRSTVRERLEKLAKASPPAPASQVYTNGIQSSDMPRESAIEEIVAWWQARKAALQQAQDGDRAVRRVTFFVEKRHEDAIKRQADLEGVTYTAIVNEALRQYFAGNGRK